MESSNLKIFLTDISTKNNSITIIASRATRTSEVLQRALEKIQVYEDPSLYELYVGAKDGSSWELADSDDHPVKMLDQSCKRTNKDNIVQIRRRSSSSLLLSTVTSASSVTSQSFHDVQDLCRLDDLIESTMLDVLQARFDKGHIYTYIGTILISINPYYLYSIYNPKYSNKYQNKRLGELSPHIFAIADDAYNSMLADKLNQSVIISGESGAGKTESTKFLLHQLMKLSSKFEDTTSLELITLGTGPVLEAFGNAKTVANNNSSRFGKFISVKFKENGAYYGASIEKYLLEKSRIISQAAGERNYHVFYYLLDGASETHKIKLHLLNPNEYRYLGQRSVVPLKGVDEVSEYNRLCESLEMLGFSLDLQLRMFGVLSAILHIGNVEFQKNEEGDSVHIVNTDVIDIISDLLNVSKGTLSEALTTRKSQIGGESIINRYKIDEAIATRDALSKALYGALFDWIVEKVNASLAIGLNKGVHKGNSIGVLDIFGFEVFQNNSFEQFCINYANEQLQQYFNKHIFKLEQEEYRGEGIQWESVEFVDNTECLDLIAKKPTGLLLLLDEECSLSGATDLSLYAKFESRHKTHPFYSSPKLKQINPVFTVAHYASDVTYSIEGFREKNKDHMRQDVIDVLATSKMDLVRAMIGLPSYAVYRWRIIFKAILAVLFFNSISHKHNPTHAHRDTTPLSPDAPFSAGSSNGPIPVSGNGSSKGSSEAFPFEYTSPVKTKIGLKLTRVYDVNNDTDGGECGQRRPSIAILLRQRIQRSVRSRIEERDKSDQFRNDLFKSVTVPRLKTDDVRPTMPNLKLNSSSGGRRVQTKTVSAEFHLSLVTLMDQLEKTHPYFVRCIKSNGEKAPKKFDPELVTRQLRYTGVRETIRIRKAGFSVRTTFQDFYNKYEFLIGKEQDNLPKQIEQFLHHDLGFNTADVQIGKSKVFMRNSQKRILQDHLESKVLSKIVLIQLWVRAKLHRCRFLLLRRSVIILQSATRGWLARKQYSLIQRRLSAVVVIQSHWRAAIYRRKYLRLKAAATILQAVWRGQIERKRWKELLKQHRLVIALERLKKVQSPPEKQARESPEKQTSRPKSTPMSVSDEVLAALLEIDLILENEEEQIDKEEDNSLINSPPRTSESSSPIKLTTPTTTTVPPLNKNVKDIINQIKRRSHSPSPPPSPKLPSDNTFSNANIKNIINKLQSSPNTSTTTTKNVAPLSRNSLASERISLFSEDRQKEKGDIKQHVLPKVKKIESPFLTKVNKPSTAPCHMKRSVSQGQIVQQIEEETEDTIVDKTVSDIVLITCETSHSLQDDDKIILSHDNHVTEDQVMTILCDNEKDGLLSNEICPEGNDEGDVFTEETEFMQKSLLRRPLKRAGGPMERKFVPRRSTPPSSLTVGSDDSQLASTEVVLSEDELELTSPNNATPTKAMRSKSTLPSHSQSLNTPNPRLYSSSKNKLRREIKSVGDNYEIDKEMVSKELPVIEQSSEFTTGVSIEGLYHINYQLRHSIDIDSSDRSDDSSPISSDQDRFIVNKKKWGKKSPVKSHKSQRKDPTHPLLSKIQRIGSPISSGESGSNTPILGASPLKHQKTRSKTVQNLPMPQYAHSYKTSSVARGQTCIVCNKSFSGFLKHGSKCVSCGIVVHKHCQGRVPVCEHPHEPGQLVKMATEKVVSTPDDLDDLAQFLVEKHHMHSHQLALLNETEYRQVDRVFQMALSEFHVNLVSTYSLSIQKTESSISLTFEQLVNKFSSIYRSMAKREELLLDACDVSIGVNQIRTFLDEFVKTRQHNRIRALSFESKNLQKLRKRKKNDRDSNVKVHKNHRFRLNQFNLVTLCDHCSNPILVLQKGEVCEVCNFSCHESCIKKINLKCEGKTWRGNSSGNNESESPTKAQFSVSLQKIQPLNNANIPMCLEKCLACIENNGLYTQGIYRKSAGGTSKRAIRQALEADPEGVDLDNYSLHAIAATVTSFFRELPEPLLTKDLYTDFIRATDITDIDEMMDTIHQIILKLPDVNHDVFQRLVFHLARVAQQHTVNKMDPHNLAIIFAPSLLQGHQSLLPQELLSVMPKQTLVLDVIITEQMKKLTATIRGIHNLSSEARITATRLSRLIASEGKEKSPSRNMITSPLSNGSESVAEEGQWEERGIDIGRLEGKASQLEERSDHEEKVIETEKKLLTFELAHIHKERAVLTASLPKLEPYSPLSDTANEFHNPSYDSLIDYERRNSLLQSSKDYSDTGRDDFLKRQSLFASLSSEGQSNISRAAKKRLSHDVSTVTKGNNFVTEDHDTTIIPDLPPVQLLKPLTKNRVSKPALAKRRKPISRGVQQQQHIDNDTVCVDDHYSNHDHFIEDSLTLFESPL